MSTVLRILVGKGVLVVRKEGRGHVYLPHVSKAEYEGDEACATWCNACSTVLPMPSCVGSLRPRSSTNRSSLRSGPP